ncbi:hypothetical protein [Ferrovibrio sp.]|uniref:hypothetical protein n=1 Tax=Ferrovibrio sp. TaxID=1917215 RepID=UPI003D286FB5
MAIYAPKPKLGIIDKKVLLLLSELLIPRSGIQGRNYSTRSVPLSDVEAETLLNLLQLLLENSNFRAKLTFVDCVFDVNRISEAKYAYFSGSLAAGRKGAMLTRRWLEFYARIGMGVESKVNIDYMTFDHFMKMEEKLLKELGLDVRVRSILLDIINQQKKEIENARAGQFPVLNTYEVVFTPIVSLLKNAQKETALLPAHKLVSLITVIGNASVLFTSRDWEILGAVSSLAGCVVNVMTPDR